MKQDTWSPDERMKVTHGPHTNTEKTLVRTNEWMAHLFICRPPVRLPMSMGTCSRSAPARLTISLWCLWLILGSSTVDWNVWIYKS